MRFHENLILQLLLYLVIQLTSSNVIFTVEESGNVTNTASRHLHKLRHSRGSGSGTPYLTASSSIINNQGPALHESFSLNCPHVVEASSKNVYIEVVWTLNETIWLKIENGQQKIVNGESTFNKRRIAGKTVMRLLLNNARYLFDYDELTGDFFMEISPVLWSTDSGAWQCHVTVRQTDGKSYTLTSRRRIKPGGEIEVRKESLKVNLSRIEDQPVKNPTEVIVKHGQREVEHVELTLSDETSKLQVQKRGDRSSNLFQNYASFSRQTDDNVYMTRKSEEVSSVIFARNDEPIIRHHKPVRHRELERLFDAQIDYELDMTDEMSYAYPAHLSTHARHSHYYQNGEVRNTLLPHIYLSLLFVPLLMV